MSSITTLLNGIRVAIHKVDSKLERLLVSHNKLAYVPIYKRTEETLWSGALEASVMVIEPTIALTPGKQYIVTIGGEAYEVTAYRYDSAYIVIGDFLLGGGTEPFTAGSNCNVSMVVVTSTLIGQTMTIQLVGEPEQAGTEYLHDYIDEAKSTADTAKSTADTAKSTADTAKSTADTAKSTADTAKSTADTAKSTADTATEKADKAIVLGGTEGVVLELAEGILPSSYGSKLVSILFPNATDYATTEAKNGIFFCENLTYIYLPKFVDKLSGWNFSHCPSLTNIDVGSDNPVYKTIDGNLYSNDGTSIYAYAQGKPELAFDIPEGVKTIRQNAFLNSQFTDVSIPVSVNFIDEYAFQHSKLVGITYAGTVEQWNAINKRITWNSTLTATEVVCSDGVVEL